MTIVSKASIATLSICVDSGQFLGFSWSSGPSQSTAFGSISLLGSCLGRGAAPFVSEPCCRVESWRSDPVFFEDVASSNSRLSPCSSVASRLRVLGASMAK